MIENELEFIKKLSQKIVRDRNITVGAKALFFYILNIENTEYPNRNKIAFDLNISNCTFGKYLNELIKNGYITCVQSKENGRFATNHYTLNIREIVLSKL